MPSVARTLVVVLPETTGRGRWQTKPMATLLLVLALAFQSICADAASVCPAGCSCQPDGEQVSCIGLTSMPRFFSRSPRTVTITQHRITGISSKSFRGMEHLEELEIIEGRLSEITHDAFSSLRHIKKVNLSHNELTVLPREAFDKCRELQQLDLSWNPLVLPGRSPMLASSSLSALDMSFCSLTQLPDTVFSKVPALSELLLRGNNLQLVSECVLDPLKDLVLMDVDPTTRWNKCSSQEATTSGVQQTVAQNGSESWQVSGNTDPTDDSLTHLQMAIVPTLSQCIVFIVAGLLLAWLLNFIRKVCQQPAEGRKEHVYEILGDRQTAQLPQNVRESSISTNSYETLTGYSIVPLGDAESRQYLPHYYRPGPALQS